MKTYYTIFLFMLTYPMYSQSFFPEPPPINPGYPFNRYLYIDCGGVIIDDITNNDALNLEMELEDYMWNNYISGIAFDGIEQIAGDHLAEQSFLLMLSRMRA